MDNASFRCVISCLQLWYIDDVPTHAGRGNEASIPEALDGIPMDSRAFLLLPPPMLASILGAVEGAVQICGDDLAIMAVVAIQHWTLCPRDPSVGDEDVEAAVKFADYGVNGFFYLKVMCDIDLVCSA